MFVLRNMTHNELERMIIALDEPKYRVKQIEDWLYRKAVGKIEDMKNLPKSLFEKLSECAVVTQSKIYQKLISKDGTLKYLLQFPDGNFVEMVLMRFDNRANLTACISSQIGCKMGCKFCHTAKQGFTRNLTAHEMVEQVLTIMEDTGLKVTNVVFMGQGEPFDNYDEVYKAIEILNTNLEIGIRRITVSTSGVVSRFDDYTSRKLLPTLAISLHAPNDKIRDLIMPVNHKYSMEVLKKAMIKFNEVTGKRITIEYILLEQFNSTTRHAEELAQYLKDVKCNINLIPYNSGDKSDFVKPSNRTIQLFKLILEKSGKKVTQRLERGADIMAACGQLTGKYLEKN